MIVSLDVDALAHALRPAVAAAAAACLPLVGSGDGLALDGAAVAAMRAALALADVDGRVVVGEGEKDEAPMLHLGERFGRAVEVAGRAPATPAVRATSPVPVSSPVPEAPGMPAIDIAVDPVDGTRLAAAGRPGAMAVIAAAGRGGFFDLGPAHYLEKLVTWVPGITGAVDAPAGTHNPDGRDAPRRELLDAVPRLVERAAALRGVDRDAVRIAVQDRPRNRAYAEAVRASGARLELFEHGDVEWSLRALHGGVVGRAGAREDGEPRDAAGLDGVVGIGGAPEGVIVAAAARALGGSMLARFAPQSAAERERVLDHLASAAGAAASRPFDAVHELDALCPGPAMLVLAAVTDCEVGLRLLGASTEQGGTSVRWWSTATPSHGRVDFLEG